MKMRKGPEKNDEKDEKKPGSVKKSALSEGLMKSAKAAALALSVGVVSASCTEDASTVIEVPDGGRDGAVTDADMGDGGVVDADRTDAEVEAGVDSGLTDATVDAEVDSGLTDATVDAEMDAGGDAGPLCTGVTNVSVSDVAFQLGTPINIGGYSITYDSLTTTGVLIDIDCGSSGASVASGYALNYGSPDTTLEVPADGKKIVMTLTSRTPWRATISVSVEDL